MIMNNKLNLSDLFQELAEKSGLNKTSAELFAKTFFAQIEEGLLQDGIVKINGWGTFKVLWNEARKSVNINTGEEIIIPGHSRITFTPEQDIKDRINEPFSYLQPTPLDAQSSLVDEVNEDSRDEHESDSTSVGDTLQKISDDADEIKSLLCDINGDNWMNTGKDDKEETASDAEEKAKEDEIDIDSKEVEVKVEVEEKEEETTVENKDEDTTLVTPEEETTTLSEELAPESSPAEETPQLTTDNSCDQPRHKGWKIVIGVAASLLLVLAGAYFYATYRVEQWAKKTIALAQDTVATQQDTVEEPDTTVCADTVQVNTLTPPTSYTHFVDTVQLTEGSRLAWLAKKYYGSAFFWVYIYEANIDNIPDPNEIPVGTIIKIPALPQELINPLDTNCIKLAKQIQEKHIQ